MHYSTKEMRSNERFDHPLLQQSIDHPFQGIGQRAYQDPFFAAIRALANFRFSFSSLFRSQASSFSIRTFMAEMLRKL